jgi:hypothetical protein
LGEGRAYRFNDDSFASESFEDEIVVLNLDDGIYYAFRGAAVVAWPYIVAGHSEPVMAGALASRYGVGADVLALDLKEFVERLLNEKILLSAPETASQIDPPKGGCSPAYEGFGFERHADLEDLLTLDPIHDVDPDKGWPIT